jgi:hypothetical protein
MIQTILVMALTFGALFLIDKGFTSTFRNKIQHKSGLSIRLPKRNGVAGILLSALAVLVLVTDFGDSRTLMVFAGVFIGVLGVGLIVYYMTFGVFYDDESFILTTFGKKSVTYRYADIVSQKLYITTGGSSIVELHMADGRAVSLQSTMEGVYPFLDKAFYHWCGQKGIDPKSCDFHDPDSSLWFPRVED